MLNKKIYQDKNSLKQIILILMIRNIYNLTQSVLLNKVSNKYKINLVTEITINLIKINLKTDFRNSTFNNKSKYSVKIHFLILINV
jgi:hypothetical protein